MPRDCCPPSRRGHSWREASADDVGLPDDPALRVCKRCGKLGRVNKCGVIYAVETP
ncbi:MAG TPA: hypothetical protein VLE97_06310 [Gaiellaceae bacterium]|nr:hypothetical protein [Gaiellaceae bacterium]